MKQRIQDSGMALLITIIFLLQASLLTLAVTWQHQQQLQFRAFQDELVFKRDVAVQQLFDQLAREAMNYATAYEGIPKKLVFSGQQAWREETLNYWMEPVPCGHTVPGESSTVCWQVDIEHSESGFRRNRRFHLNEAGCESYWYIAEI